MKAAGIILFVLGICVAISAAGKLSPGKELNLTAGFQKADSEKIQAEAEAAKAEAEVSDTEANRLHAFGEVFEQTATRIDADKTVSEISNAETKESLLKLAQEHRAKATLERTKAKVGLATSKSLSAKATLKSEKHITSKKAVQDATSWPTSLPGFGGGMALCAIGLFLWWKTTLDVRARDRAELDSGEGSVPGPVQLVAQVQQPLRELAADVAGLDGPELCNRVELLIFDFITPLADGRQRFVDRFGLAGGSEALNATAFGERMLNRVWSAAADGHLEEARSSFAEAVEAFTQAEETVARLAAGA